jgi:hypothetical protein
MYNKVVYRLVARQGPEDKQDYKAVTKKQSLLYSDN